MSEFDEDGEGFGQNVDLTQRIREILGSYPEGTSIIKELIQNADDATASKFKLCFDKRNLGTESLLGPKLAQFQGPSILCYNNKKFSQQDYDAIRKVGAGAKRKDVAKTGRFGIGFNAVYHLTDLPSFVSGPYCVYFDPHIVSI